MKLRHKASNTICHSSEFNTSSLTEILVGYAYDDGTWEQDSDYMHNFDVQLPSGEWKDLRQAFADRDVIPNNYNTHFGPPTDEEARKRGYNP